MPHASTGVIDTLRNAVLRYGAADPRSVRRYGKGERVIEQGAVSDICYLIQSGTLSILVKGGGEDKETEIALRYAGELIGETAFLERGVPRTASVIVYSLEVELIAITRAELYGLLAQDCALR